MMKVQNLFDQRAVVPMHSFIQNEAGHLGLVSVVTIRSTWQGIVHPQIHLKWAINCDSIILMLFECTASF